jgi:thymidylate synthase (FAD)
MPDDDKTSESPRLARPIVAELEEVLGKPLRVLDDGFVRLIDYMGDDASVVQAARVSYGVGTKRIRDDRGLIRYLMRHSHTTPFEMCEIKLHVRAPMDVWRQWIRHRTAHVNEYSTRYSLAIASAQKTPAEDWRLQSFENRQGSIGFLPRQEGERLTASETELQRVAREVYERRIEAGVAREQARKDLPLSTYTEAYWKIDLHNLLHFLELRMNAGAQEEIRAYAITIAEKIVAKWVPMVWESFADYKLKSVNLSAVEIEVLRMIISKDEQGLRKRFEALKWLETDAKNNRLKRNREREELIEKLHEYFGYSIAFIGKKEGSR